MHLSLSFWVFLALLFACVSALFTFVRSDGKHRTALLIFSMLGCLITYLGARRSIEGYQKTEAIVEGYKSGGDAYPIISLELTDDGHYYTFTVINSSHDYTLYDIEAWFVEVSARTTFVYDDSLPALFYEDKFLQPSSKSETGMYFKDFKLDYRIPEKRYNFFIQCKNGFFEEQLVIRQQGNEPGTAIRILKDNKVIYTSDVSKSFLFPGEKKLAFQDGDEGLIKETMDIEREKWRARQTIDN